MTKVTIATRGAKGLNAAEVLFLTPDDNGAPSIPEPTGDAFKEYLDGPRDAALEAAEAAQGVVDQQAANIATVEAGVDATAADRFQTGQDRIASVGAAGATAADRIATGGDAAGSRASRVAAEQAQAFAQAALPAAQALANLFADTATGVAAVAEGAFFTTPGSGAAAAIVYRKVAGVAAEVTQIPSKLAIDQAQPKLTEAPGAFVIRDPDGYAVFAIEGDGTVLFPALDRVKAAADAGALVAGSFLFGPGGGFVIRDLDGYASFIVDPDGTVLFAGLDKLRADATAGAAVAAQVQFASGVGFVVKDDQGNAGLAFDPAEGLLTPTAPDYGVGEIGVVISYGQSLSFANTAGEVMTTEPVPGGLRFASGVRPSDGGTDPAVIYASLVPLIETSDGVLYGETPCAGFVRGYNAGLQAIRGRTLVQSGLSWVGLATGLGGLTIGELGPGSIYYQRTLDALTALGARLAEQGKSLGPVVIMLTQGHADQGQRTPGLFWQRRAAAIRDGVEAHVRALTGNPSRVVTMIVNLLADHHVTADATRASIATAQIEMSQRYPNIHLGTTMAHLPHQPPLLGQPPAPNVHLGALGTFWFGAINGYQAAQIIEGVDAVHAPPRVTAARRSGSAIVLDVVVPSRTDVTIERDLVLNAGDDALIKVRQAVTRAPIAITGARVFGGRHVALTCTPPALPGALVEGGQETDSSWTGPNGAPRVPIRDMVTATIGDLAGSTAIQARVTANNALAAAYPAAVRAVPYPLPLFNFAAPFSIGVN